MIEISTQSELNKHIAAGESEFRFVKVGRFEVRCDARWIKVYVAAELKYDCRVEAWDSSSVEARDSSRVEARDSSSVVARDSSRVVALDSSRVVALDSSRVEARYSSSVEAWDSSSVEARDSSRVEARDSSRVEAWDSSSVDARDSSRVEAWDSSRVVAWDSSSVVAWDSSSVEAWDSSSVEARDSSIVVARDSSIVVARDSSSVVARDSSRVVARDSSRVVASGFVSVQAFGGTIKLSAKCHAFIRDKKAKVSGGTKTDAILKTNKDWCDHYGVKTERGLARVYKAVNKDYASDRDPSFKYTPGTKPKAPEFDAKECSHGLHFCPTTRATHVFLSNPAHYLECWVSVKDMLVFFNGTYPQKCKAPEVKRPIVEVDIDGNPIEQKVAS